MIEVQYLYFQQILLYLRSYDAINKIIILYLSIILNFNYLLLISIKFIYCNCSKLILNKYLILDNLFVHMIYKLNIDNVNFISYNIVNIPSYLDYLN